MLLNPCKAPGCSELTSVLSQSMSEIFGGKRKSPTVHSVVTQSKLVPRGSPKCFEEINDISDVVILKYVVNCIIIYAIYFIHIFF